MKATWLVLIVFGMLIGVVAPAIEANTLLDGSFGFSGDGAANSYSAGNGNFFGAAYANPNAPSPGVGTYFTWAGGSQTAVITPNAWEEVKFVVDQATDTTQLYYGGVLQGTATGAGAGIGFNEIEFYAGTDINGAPPNLLAGPIYIDNVKVTNNNVPVFSDNFDSYGTGTDLRTNGSGWTEWVDPSTGLPYYNNNVAFPVVTGPVGSGSGTNAMIFDFSTTANRAPTHVFADQTAGTIAYSFDLFWPGPVVTPVTTSKLVSVDFVTNDGDGNNPTHYLTPTTGNTAPTGPNQNTDGLGFSGQSGPWNAFTIGGNNTNETTAGPSGALLAADGSPTTIHFSMDAPNTWRDNFVTSDGALRNDAAYLYASAVTGESLNWHITGLIPSHAYSLIMFGTDPANSSNTANGVAGALDADGDFNWLSITANSLGEINGVFTYINLENETTPGIQGFQLGWNPVPEPSSLILLGLGAMGMIRFARRRRS